MRFRLRTLLIVLALGSAVLAALWWYLVVVAKSGTAEAGAFVLALVTLAALASVMVLVGAAKVLEMIGPQVIQRASPDES